MSGETVAAVEELAWSIRGPWCECAAPDQPCAAHQAIEKSLMAQVEAIEAGLGAAFRGDG